MILRHMRFLPYLAERQKLVTMIMRIFYSNLTQYVPNLNNHRIEFRYVDSDSVDADVNGSLCSRSIAMTKKKKKKKNKLLALDMGIGLGL